MTSKEVIFKDDGDWAEMLFPNGNSILVKYKYMSEKQFTFSYYLKSVNGTMKVTPAWCDKYDDILGQAECGLNYLFLPEILNHLYQNDLERKTSLEKHLNLYRQGKAKWDEIPWTVFVVIREDNGKGYEKAIKLHGRILVEIEKMQKLLIKNNKVEDLSLNRPQQEVV